MVRGAPGDFLAHRNGDGGSMSSARAAETRAVEMAGGSRRGGERRRRAQSRLRYGLARSTHAPHSPADGLVLPTLPPLRIAPLSLQQLVQRRRKNPFLCMSPTWSGCGGTNARPRRHRQPVEFRLAPAAHWQGSNAASRVASPSYRREPSVSGLHMIQNGRKASRCWDE